MEEFLTNMGMEKYIQTFTNNGFSDIATIINLCDDDFKVMRIPLGHKLKILKRIKDFKSSKTDIYQESTSIKNNVDPIVEKESKSEIMEIIETEKIKPSVPKVDPIDKEENKIIESKVIHRNNPVPNIQASKETNETDHEYVKESVMKTKRKVEQTSEACQSDDIIYPKINEKKESCWNCYKVFIKGTGYFDTITNKVIFN